VIHLRKRGEGVGSNEAITWPAQICLIHKGQKMLEVVSHLVGLMMSTNNLGNIDESSVMTILIMQV
jgi:hypothetical protein